DGARGLCAPGSPLRAARGGDAARPESEPDAAVPDRLSAGDLAAAGAVVSRPERDLVSRPDRERKIRSEPERDRAAGSALLVLRHRLPNRSLRCRNDSPNAGALARPARRHRGRSGPADLRDPSDRRRGTPADPLRLERDPIRLSAREERLG